jgi:large conductance mechanosensitive channel
MEVTIMKKFFGEFKSFITRGNVLDMAIGVIVGGAFNTIVTTMNSKILMPVINWVLSYISGNGTGLYTILPNSKILPVGSTEEGILGPDGLTYQVLNYIDWSALIESVFNFFFIALTLFVIIKTVTYLGKKRQELEDKLEEKFKKDDESEGVKAE